MIERLIFLVFFSYGSVAWSQVAPGTMLLDTAQTFALNQTTTLSNGKLAAIILLKSHRVSGFSIYNAADETFDTYQIETVNSSFWTYPENILPYEGGFYIVSRTSSGFAVYNFDNSAELTWARFYELDDYTRVFSAALSSNNGVLVCGNIDYTYYYDPEWGLDDVNTHGFEIEIKNDGEVGWSKFHGLDKNHGESTYQIISLNDSVVLCAGSQLSANYLRWLDNNGELIRTQVFKFGNKLTIRGVRLMSDGEHVIMWTTKQVLKMNLSTGEIDWIKKPEIDFSYHIETVESLDSNKSLVLLRIREGEYEDSINYISNLVLLDENGMIETQSEFKYLRSMVMEHTSKFNGVIYASGYRNGHDIVTKVITYDFGYYETIVTYPYQYFIRVMNNDLNDGCELYESDIELVSEEATSVNISTKIFQRSITVRPLYLNEDFNIEQTVIPIYFECGFDTNESNLLDSLESDEIRLYPNPGVDGFAIGFNLEEDAEVTLLIRNGQGKLIEMREMGSFQKGQHQKHHALNAGSGVYYVGIETSTGASIWTKFILVAEY